MKEGTIKLTEIKFVVDTHHFQGWVHSAINQDGTVGYNKISQEEYFAKEGHKHLSIVTEKALNIMMEDHYKEMEGPWKETTEDQYWDQLECLPPTRWTKFGSTNDEFFFCSEAQSGHMHSIYAQYKGKYYCTVKSVFTKTSDILTSLSEI